MHLFGSPILLKPGLKSSIFMFALSYYCFGMLSLLLKTFCLLQYTETDSLLAFNASLPRGDGFVQRPRVLEIMTTDLLNSSRPTSRPCFRPQNRTNAFWLDNNKPNRKYRRYPPRDKGCIPLGTWQDEVHLSCLDFHEIDMPGTTFVAHGYHRDTWLFHEYDGTKRALKMLRVLNKDYSYSYDYVNTDFHRKDAVAALQLSSSPYIANIYSYCSSSAVQDFANGHLWDIFSDPSNGGPDKPPTKDELFKYAHDAAMGLVAFHHLDPEGRVTMVHGDIKPSQFIQVSDGKYQLNDFNLCEFASWNVKENKFCDVDDMSWKERENLDIYNLGELFIYLLGGKWPYEDPKTVPRNRTHPFDIYVNQAMKMCLRKDHNMTAQQVAALLHKAYTKYQKVGMDMIKKRRKRKHE